MSNFVIYAHTLTVVGLFSVLLLYNAAGDGKHTHNCAVSLHISWYEFRNDIRSQVDLYASAVLSHRVQFQLFIFTNIHCHNNRSCVNMTACVHSEPNMHISLCKLSVQKLLVLFQSKLKLETNFCWNEYYECIKTFVSAYVSRNFK